MERQAAPTESRKYVILQSNSVGNFSNRDGPGCPDEEGFGETRVDFVLNRNFFSELPGEVFVGERVLSTSVAMSNMALATRILALRHRSLCISVV